MDLTLELGQHKLNIRVAVLVRTTKGVLFEKGKDGYYFALGGRVKIGESSFDAAKREVQEEIGLHVDVLKLVSIVENFFTHKGFSFHEVCFVYLLEDIVDLELPENIVAFTDVDLQSKDVRPEVIKKIINEKQEVVSHFIININN
jgi:8-oxo-dGTP pyrophosphatase MutT (NUDIX family)